MQISIPLRKVTKNISLSPKEKVMGKGYFSTKKDGKCAFCHLKRYSR